MGVVGVVAGISAIASAFLGRPLGMALIRAPFGWVGIIFAAIALPISLLQVAAGVGLLRKKPWGASCAIVFAYISLSFAALEAIVSLLVRSPIMSVPGGMFTYTVYVVIQFSGLVQWSIYPVLCLVLLRSRPVSEFLNQSR